MKKTILKFIGKKNIVNYLLEEIQFDEDAEVQTEIWKNVFLKVPDIKKWMKMMQVRLLKQSIVEKDKTDFIKGQIYILELLQNYDVPGVQSSPIKDRTPQTIEKKVEFKSRWKNANNKIGEKGKEEITKPVRK